MFCLAMNQLYVDFVIKHCKRHYKVGQLKLWQVLQNGTGIKKRGNIDLKLGQYNYKVMQHRRQMRETGESIHFGNLILYSPKTSPLEILQKLKFI